MYIYKIAALDEAFLKASTVLKITDFSAYKKIEIQKLVIEKLDI